MTKRGKAAWDDFWGTAHRGDQRPAGCLPSQMDPVSKQQCAAWQAFASLLPHHGRVLDLATGDGRVLGWLHGTRPDLELTGIDLAAQLPAAPAGTATHAGVAMEALPFTDGSFDSIVSQFGLEYADLPLAAREIDRVLGPEGLVGVVTHRLDGPILAHNLARAEHIRWVLDEQQLPARAKAAVAARLPGSVAVPAELAAIPALGARMFGPRSAAWEIAEAIRRAMDYGRHDSVAGVANLVTTIEQRARSEIARIEDLARACTQTGPGGALEAAMAACGLVQSESKELVSQFDGRAFADFRLFQRATTA